MKKRRRIGAGLLCAALLLTGCQNTVETAIVTPKQAISGARMLDGSAVKSVQEQVQAPETCTLKASGEKGALQIVVDAKVTVPEAEGIRLKKTETRVFQQNDMDGLSEKLLQGNPLWRRIYTGDQEIHDRCQTKAELQERIEKLRRNRSKIEARAKKNGWGEDYWTQNYEQMCSMRDEAPESFQTEQADSKVTYDAEAARWYWTEEGNVNVVWGGVTLEGTDYNFMLNNNWNEGFKCAGVYLARGVYREYDGWNFFLAEMPCIVDSRREEMWRVNAAASDGSAEYDEESEELKITEEELKKEGDALVQALGLEHMELAACKESIQIEAYYYPFPEAAENLIYMPVIDGIPVTYTDSRYLFEEDEVDYSERFEAVWDDEGLVQVLWENPMKIYDMSDEYVFLLPFSDILKTFQEKAGDALEEEYRKREEMLPEEIPITDIRLGYMWVPDTATEMEGMLIPVWDFIVRDAEHTVSRSFVTINAMDGKLVKGYRRPY